MNGVRSLSLSGLLIHTSLGFYRLLMLYDSQLEAIIRISESLSKMTLSPVVQTYHVEEAIRLFRFSTMDAVSAGSVDGISRGELNQEVSRIEKEIRRRLPVGWSTSYQSLVREFVTQQGYSNHSLERTLFVLEKREIIRFSGQVCGWITSL
jgi:DNA replication licensing factor MCM5